MTRLLHGCALLTPGVALRGTITFAACAKRFVAAATYRAKVRIWTSFRVEARHATTAACDARARCGQEAKHQTHQLRGQKCDREDELVMGGCNGDRRSAGNETRPTNSAGFGSVAQSRFFGGSQRFPLEPGK
jgi:hypothetical protein